MAGGRPAAEIGRAAGAVSWDIEPLETLIEDLRRAERAARGAEEYRWVSSGAIALHLVCEVDASTAAQADAAATARVEVLAGWRAEPAAAPLA